MRVGKKRKKGFRRYGAVRGADCMEKIY